MLGESIKMLRQSRNWSQVDLARDLGVSKQSVSNWENENIQPSIEMLIKLSEVFSVSTDYLLGLETTRQADLTGLSDQQAAHIQQLIDDLRKANGRKPL